MTDVVVVDMGVMRCRTWGRLLLDVTDVPPLRGGHQSPLSVTSALLVFCHAERLKADQVSCDDGCADDPGVHA